MERTESSLRPPHLLHDLLTLLGVEGEQPLCVLQLVALLLEVELEGAGAQFNRKIMA